MGTGTICDGCNQAAKATETVGTIDPLDYCENCAGVVSSYLHARDALHEVTATSWEIGLEKLKADVLKKCPEMTLPDV